MGNIQSGYACPRCHSELYLIDSKEVYCATCNYSRNIESFMSNLFDLYKK
jgi:uncharacterized Zn finger protein (UPF0148 family)